VKRWALGAIAAYALAAAFVVQGWGWTQTSHYGLVRALSHGTAVIDRWHEETGDKAWTNGHFYSVKAPGLALVVLPEYLVLKTAGVMPDRLRPAIWLLGLLGTVIPAAALLLLLRHESDQQVPGAGIPAAIALGLGTLLFPFATLLFGHVLSALCAFAAFTVLLAERRIGGSARLLALAGLLAGAAAFVEYPAGLVALILVGLVVARPARLRRLAAYVAGVAVPVALLAAYNRWAFGSFTHLSYEDAVIIQGKSGHDVIGAASEGFFGVTAPSPRVALELLLARRGFLATTPVVGAALAGLFFLYRAGRRAEALTAGAVFAAFLIYNAGITTPFGGPFGGDSPGPRYMTVAVPFLAGGLAMALRRAPGATLALAAGSIVSMVAATATQPLLRAPDGLGRWLHLVGAGDFTATVITPLGIGRGWLAILPFLLLAVASAALAARGIVVPSRHVLAAGVVALVTWLLVATSAPPMLAESAARDDWLPLVAVAVLAAAAIAVVLRVERRRYAGVLGLLPLAAARLVYDRPGLVLLLAVASLAAAAGALALDATRMSPSASGGRARYSGRTAVK
jgi:hypothetical protein